MKHIVKGSEPKAFTAWKQKGSITYDDLVGKEKRVVKQALLKEQGWICCYCERTVSDNDSHIEHLRPQSDPAVDSLDYGNMLCSCQRQRLAGEPRHCGNKKRNWFDAALLVSPLDPGCEARFSYLWDGSISPASKGDKAVAATIKRLGLGIDKLMALRRAAMEPFLDEGLSIADLKVLTSNYLRRDKQGHFSAFHTTIRHLFS